MKRSGISAILLLFLLLFPLAGGDQVIFETQEPVTLIYTGETKHVVKFMLPSLEGAEFVEVTIDARVTPSGYNEFADGIGGLIILLNSELPIEGDFGAPTFLLDAIEEDLAAFKDIALHSLWFIPAYIEGSMGTRGVRKVRFDRSTLLEGQNILLFQVVEGEDEGDGIFLNEIRVNIIGELAQPLPEKKTPFPVIEKTEPEVPGEVTRPPPTEKRAPRTPATEPSAPATQPQETNWEAVGVILVVAGGATGWMLSRRKRGRVKKLIDEIDTIYSSFKMKSRRCEAELYRLKDMILEEFKNGRIDDNSFAILDKRIEDYLREVREQIVNERFGGIPLQLKENLKTMMEDGDISEKDYATLQHLLKEASGVKEKDKEELRELFEKWKKEDQK
ncbi:MAG: hypothetical protein ACE5HY_04035 [Candidatus Hydrothermarchaeales archaeon]